MKEKEEEMKKVFSNLTEQNKDIVMLLTKGIEVAQSTKVS